MLTRYNYSSESDAVQTEVLSHFKEYTATMAKRSRESDVQEFDDISDVCASPNAKIHGVLNSVSPLKKSKGCAYFDGQITDGKTTMRLFGFDSSVRRRLAEFPDSTPVALSHCQIKKSRKGEQLEVSHTTFM